VNWRALACTSKAGRGCSLAAWCPALRIEFCSGYPIWALATPPLELLDFKKETPLLAGAAHPGAVVAVRTDGLRDAPRRARLTGIIVHDLSN
jgi:hypothetical protein